MTAVEKLRQLIEILPEKQVNEVLNFAEFLLQKQIASPQHITSSQKKGLASGTLTGLRGIAKRAQSAASDEALQAEYTDYLAQKYR